MTRSIVFIADDFGLNEKVNDAIIYCHRNGVLNGTALMLGQSGTDHAVNLARENPQLEIGWHLHIVDSQPLSCKEWPWRTPAAAGFAIGLSRSARKLVQKEIEMQWNAFLETGLHCSFINAHHHLSIHPFVRKTLVATVGNDFDGWFRWGKIKFFGDSQSGYHILDKWLLAPHRTRLPFKLSSSLWGIDRSFSMNAEEIVAIIPTLSEGLHEFMFHPRKIEADQDTRCLLELKNKIL